MTAYPAHARTDGAGCTIRDDSIPFINDMRVDTKHPERIRKRKTKAINWQLALQKKVTTSELREQYVHAHGVMLQAMGNLGSDLIKRNEDVWKRTLKKLKDIDWLRTNPNWETRSMENGRISKARVKVVLTGNYIKQQLGVQLTTEEENFERKHAA